MQLAAVQVLGLRPYMRSGTAVNARLVSQITQQLQLFGLAQVQPLCSMRCSACKIS